MKLFISVQYQESDGNRWRNKGGTSFIVENISFNQRQTIQRYGIPFLSHLLESGKGIEDDEIRGDEFFTRRYINHFELIEDDTDLVETGLLDSWETPWILTYSKKLKSWTANRFVKNNGFWKTSKTGKYLEGKWQGYVLGEQSKYIDFKEHYQEAEVA